MRTLLSIIVILFITAVVSSSTVDEDRLKKINAQASAKENYIKNLPEHKKKLDGYLLDFMDKINADLQDGRISDKQYLKEYLSTPNLPINSDGALKIQILLADTLSQSQFDMYIDWLKIREYQSAFHIILRSIFIIQGLKYRAMSHWIR